jgi:D-alanyl-lipoteichoic acid acyltransferase DltB (MBOAT superfamily)
MLFNSYEFIFVFLPCVVVLYHAVNAHSGAGIGKATLLGFSWLFYAWWNPVYLPLLLLSIGINYRLSKKIMAFGPENSKQKKRLFLLAIVLNAGGLAYFKYMDFFIANLNWLGFDIPLLHLALPLAISFFTLQQIAYIVDSYRGVDCSGSFLDYCLFVSFFPQLIAGPIVHHREIIPQLRDPERQGLNFTRLTLGSFLLAMGLFKKVVIAGTLSGWATNGFDDMAVLNVTEAWIVSYSYMFQVYFDFSGYSDIAIGLALMFGIRLPQNFNSPLAATSIINFWQRWHLTLTRFINMYIYRPILRALPRVSFGYHLIASFIAMFIAGVWHGAAWTFVAFGSLHGISIVINHIWRKTGLKLPAFVGWFLTINLFNISTVMFRAKSWDDAVKVYEGMLGLSGGLQAVSYQQIFQGQSFWYFDQASSMVERNQWAGVTCILFLAYCTFHVTRLPNSQTLADRFQFDWRHLASMAVLFLLSIGMLGESAEFIYFQF